MKYFFLILLLFFATKSWSQQLTFVFKGQIENQDLGKKEGGVTVSIVQGGATVASTKSSSNGKYSVEGIASYVQPFTVVFSKPGMVSKMVRFNLSKLNEEDIPPGEVYRPVESLDMSLFNDRESVDFSFLDSEPVADFEWDERKMRLRYDQAASNRIRTKIEELLKADEKNKAEMEAKYQAAISAADAAYNKKEYENALSKYEEALTYKPNEKYPADRILELDALIQSQKEQELAQQQADAKYNNLISAADNLRDNGELEKAISMYQEALNEKDEQYPKDQIASIQAQIEAKKKEAENQAKYDEAIKSADAFFKQNSLRAARDKYKEASELKPSEQYPKDKLSEIEKKLKEKEEQEAKKKKYDEAIAAADDAFSSDDFELAKEKYEEALSFESSSTYAKERIKMCNAAIAEEKAEAERLAKIEELLKKGEEEFAQEKLEDAKSTFEEVLSLDDQNAKALSKITEIDQLLEDKAKMAQKEAEFNELVKAGDAAVAKEDYSSALKSYQDAIAIKSSPEVEAKIDSVQEEIAKLEAAEEQQAKYDQLIADGQSKMTAGDLEGAKSDFESALSIDPSQSLPKEKIDEINAMLAEQAAAEEQQAKYDQLIAEGSQLMAAEDLTQAKSKYEEALSLKPEESEPKEKLEEIEKLLEEKRAQQDQASQYAELVADGEAKLAANNLSGAKAAFKEAQKVDPSQTLPGEKIAQIDALISAQKEELEAKEKQAEYAAKIEEADKLLESGQLERARDFYEEAIQIDGAQPYPKQKISEIESQLANQEANAAKQEEIAELLTEGNTMFASNKLEEAKEKYNAVLAIDPENPEAKAQLKAVNDKILAEKSASEAEEQLEQKYNAFLAEGNDKLNSGDYQGAISAFQSASKLKPQETLPKSKIAEAESLIAQMKSNEEKDAKYSEALEEGKRLMAEEKYLEAISFFNEALKYKPNESEPKKLAAEAERLERELGEVDEQYEKILTVAEKKMNEGDFDRAIELVKRAQSFKPEDDRPKKMLAEINRFKKIEEDYSKAILEGGEKLENKDYQGAKSAYEKAKSLKPNEPLPQEKINEIEELIKNEKSASKVEELYADNMAKGEMTLKAKRYEEALGYFKNALNIQPNDSRAQAKINEVQQILDNLANANEEELKKKQAFDQLIKEADALFAEQKYVPFAKNKYEEALTIFPTSSYALSQRDECVKLARSKVDEEKEKQYKKLIAAADKSFNSEDYDKAKDYYTRAVNFKSNDPYPKEKLKEIERILNPVVVGSEQLVDLGEPYDGSILDGAYLLEKAEEERVLLKGVRIQNEYDKVHNSASEMTAMKAEDRLNTTNEIYQLQRKIRVETIDSDESRKATVEALRKAERERDELERANLQFEKADNLSSQGELNRIKDEGAIQYGEDISVYRDNAASVEKYNRSNANQLHEMSVSKIDDNRYTDAELNKIKMNIVTDDIDDLDERLAEKERVNDVIRKVDYKTVEDAKIAELNGMEIKSIQNDVNALETKRAAIEQDHAYQTDKEVAEVKRKAQIDASIFEANREESTEKFKEIQVAYEAAQVEAYNNETKKYLRNKQILDSEEARKSDISKKADEALAKKIAYVEKVDKKAIVETEEALQSDLDDRLNVRKEVENVQLAQMEEVKKDAKEHVENVEKLKDVNKTANQEATNEAARQKEKTYENQNAINKVDNTQKPKKKVANALGEEYPEGVTQESFTRKDKNGLVTAVITRRIVVIDGHADVYVRTQSKNGITYSKNGIPSLEHVWNSETQNPNLERHF